MKEENGAVVEYSAKWWADELDKCGKTLNEKWRDSARKVVNRYLDERSDEQSPSSQRRYNIFWANVQILKSALYAVPPTPEVKRQHDDSKDDIARTGALILERMLNFDLQADDSKEHAALEHAVEDRLVPGLGQVWCRYDVQTEKFAIPAIVDPLTGMEIQPAGEGERIVDETVYTELVHWDDFFWSPARTWDEVWWVGRRVWMKKKKFIARFGKEKWAELSREIQDVREREGYPKGFEKGRVEVFELWCEETNRVYWIHKQTCVDLDSKDDPYQLEGFFPCPKPLIATHTTSSLIPRPDFVMVQDQYDELDVLNDRIYTLTRALRVVGAYDSSFSDLGKMLSGSELSMIPVDSWAAFAEKGGLKGCVDWFPVEVVANVLERLMVQRTAVIQQIYELTSISDIMRGVSQARETAKAQTLKAQYSSVRLQLTQQQVAKFVQSVLRLKVEMITNLFQPETIIKKSQIEMTESAPLAQAAVQLIKDRATSQFRIKVGEQSLSMADYNAEREMRVEFLTAIGQFLSQAGQMAAAYPAALPYLLRMISWVAASFRGADDIETVLDEAIQGAANMPPQPPQDGKPQAPPEPPPEQQEMAKAQGAIAVNRAKTQDQARLNAQQFRFDAAKEIIRAQLTPPPVPPGDGNAGN